MYTGISLIFLFLFFSSQVFAVELDSGLFTNHIDLLIEQKNNSYAVAVAIEVDEYNMDTLEVQLAFEKSLTKVLNILAGTDYVNTELYAVLGMAFNLPHEIDIISYVRHNGAIVISLQKNFQITKKLNFNFATENDYKNVFGWWVSGELAYDLNKNASFGLFYKKVTDVGGTLGIGVRLVY